MEAVVNRKMVDLSPQHAKKSVDIGFYSDASAAEDLGFGAVLQEKWLQGFWTKEFVRQANPSIEFLELFALCTGIFAWEEALSEDHFKIHCDNIAVVHMINKLTSSCKNCMFLLRLLTLSNLKFNRKLSAVYINTKLNVLLDALSRNQMSRFRRLGPDMNAKPDPILDPIWPIWKVWQA